MVMCYQLYHIPTLTPLLSQTMDQLKRLLDTINVNYTENIFETNEGVDGLEEDPFSSGSRIFVFATYANNARALLCKVSGAAVIGLRYRPLTWLQYMAIPPSRLIPGSFTTPNTCS